MSLQLRLDYRMMQYTVTKLETTHNHTTCGGEFKHYSTARRLDGHEERQQLNYGGSKCGK